MLGCVGSRGRSKLSYNGVVKITAINAAASVGITVPTFARETSKITTTIIIIINIIIIVVVVPIVCLQLRYFQASWKGLLCVQPLAGAAELSLERRRQSWMASE
jgi:hypothetical protein